jgi:heat shock protein HslJ
MFRALATVLVAAASCAAISACSNDTPVAADDPPAKPAAEPVAAAVAATTVLRATGNEPGWRLDMNATGIVLTTPEGETRAGAPAIDTTFEDGAVLYVATGDKGEVAVKVVDRVCSDSMSGMPHPQSVQVWFGGQELRGCGGDPASLLHGPEWSVEDIGGSAVVKDSKVTLNFGSDGNLSGGSSCNRFMTGYTLSGEALTISQSAGSMMMCDEPLMNQERAFLALLATVNQFSIDPDGALLLKSSDGRSIRARR